MTLKSLKQLDLATRTVETSAGNLAVRGLSVREIFNLAELFRPTMATLFEELAKAAASNSDASVSAEQAMAITVNLFREAPEFIASVIVLGAGDQLDDEASMATARLLDVGSQVALINAIAELTFAAGGGMGNVVRLLMSAIAGVSSQAASRTI